jgi:hypothetical protein
MVRYLATYLQLFEFLHTLAECMTHDCTCVHATPAEYALSFVLPSSVPGSAAVSAGQWAQAVQGALDPVLGLVAEPGSSQVLQPGGQTVRQSRHMLMCIAHAATLRMSQLSQL